VKLDAIGDLVLATPFLRELKRSFPAATITLVVTPTAPLVELCPYTDKVIKSEPFGPERHDCEFHILRISHFLAETTIDARPRYHG
jgi:ADP-heptose:LPS heptosyltransferase